MDPAAVREVLEFLVVNGPARNDAEREHLLGLIAPQAPAEAQTPAETPLTPGGEF